MDRLLRSALLAGLVAASVGCAAEHAEDDAEASTEAVVGGSETRAVPAIGYLAHGFAADGRWLVVLPFCTGTLIAPDVVVTAAHCVEEAKSKGYALHFGTGVPREPEVLVPVAEAVMHPGYGPAGRHAYAFDIAYLVLSEPIHGVPLAKIATEEHEGGCDYVATGYGTKKVDHVHGDPILDSDTGYRKALSVCAEPGYTVSQSLVTNATIRVKSDDGSLCEGDSGGPLRRNDTRVVYGVLSNLGPAGDGVTCTKGAASYYAPVAYSRPFLAEGLAKSRAR